MRRWITFLCVVGTVSTWVVSVGAASLQSAPAPVSNPVLFEAPTIETNIRSIFAYHELSDSFISQGGNAKIAALQLRVALTDRLALIATKDGYVWLEPDQVLPRKNGWANLGIGLKYALVQSDAYLLSAGLRYEVASGDKDVFQGRGAGLLNPFLSAGVLLNDRLSLLGYTGPRLPISGNDTTFWDTSAHVSYMIGPFAPLIEVNWVHALDGGRRLPVDQEGFDFFNLGSRTAAGRGVVVQGYGFRYRVGDEWELAGKQFRAELGAVYETPLTDREDLFGWRVTTDVMFRIR